MGESAIMDALTAMGSGGELMFSLSDIPFDELLLHLHMARFTGVVEIGKAPEHDRVFLREGAAVGVRPRADQERVGLRDAVVALKLASPEVVSAALDGTSDSIAFGQQLLESGLLKPAGLDRVVEEQARRRLFAVYDMSNEPVRVAQGLDRLAHFHPVFVDVRPAIAFGMVVRSGPDRKAAMMDRVRGKTVRLVAPYDEQRNGYGLPPPVLLALRDLANGITLNGEISLPGLSASETAGVLVLLDRMLLLKIE